MGKSCRGILDYLTLPKVARLPDEYYKETVWHGHVGITVANDPSVIWCCAEQLRATHGVLQATMGQVSDMLHRLAMTFLRFGPVCGHT